jgi:stearoyl-CoA desaturase (delta-9 desaturase)
MVGLAKVKKLAPAPKFAKASWKPTSTPAIGDRQPLRRDGQVRQIDQSAWKEELEHLKHKAELEARFLKSSRKLLQREPGKLEAPHSSSCRNCSSTARRWKPCTICAWNWA